MTQDDPLARFFYETECIKGIMDATGKLLKMHVEEGGMDAAEPYTEVYEILSTDNHGNWTKRRVKTGSQQSVHTRVISYY